ncbi:late secretory pathway protein AVL9 homolog [Leptopilina heterotoma]|uniref:late secretory pathway protein AVL9 homolog n=1 Tax=Leptopilina heterotoma TaxID=63436 RepID=UPI001CA80C9E|nr:late secretory pathway protein AVL9 homolog [Leptopilina heterotoma]
MAETEGPILHIIVIGFHHKKGCQVEFSFPPLVPEAPNECPLNWRYLPSLALPDGSHNYDEDTVFFHLPSLTDPKCTIYGISCFKQIPVERLKCRTSDITRGTVQKSVCILSTLPLYGHIQVKVALITNAYFEEGDFSKISLLKETYYHLNSCMKKDSQIPLQIFGGLSARDLILQFRHKVLLLFKLLLLEKKLVFFQSPVHPLCTTILTLLSLFPGMIESGLKNSTYIRVPTSPVSNDENISVVDSDLPNLYSLDQKSLNKEQNDDINLEKEISYSNYDANLETLEQECKEVLNDEADRSRNSEETLENKYINKANYEENSGNSLTIKDDLNTVSFEAGDGDGVLSKNSNSLLSVNTWIEESVLQAASINTQKCGLPLQIFSEGYLCLPYLSLPYLELLSDKNVRGYVVGATNVLFKQKKQLIDVLIDIENGRIEANDPELRRYLHLTTEDLRFIDYVIRCVVEPRKENILDSSTYHGGEEWIRLQFKMYLLHLLRTSMQYDTRETDHFNTLFISAWRTTNNYKKWKDFNSTEITSIEPRHPFVGQLSVQDMKLRLTHSMQNTESGRKLNQAMLTTGKAVGGALSQAKGAFSTWWNTLTAVQPINVVRDNTLPEEEREQHAFKVETDETILNKDFLRESINYEKIIKPN